MVVTKPPGEEGGKLRKREGSGRDEERRSAAGRGEGEGKAEGGGWTDKKAA